MDKLQLQLNQQQNNQMFRAKNCEIGNGNANPYTQHYPSVLISPETLPGKTKNKQEETEVAEKQAGTEAGLLLAI